MEVREQGFENRRGWRKQSPSRPAIPALLGFLIMGLTVFGGGALAAESESRPRITVITNNLAQAPGRTMEEGRAVASRILLLAGVESLWRKPADLETAPADLRRGDEVRITLNIIPREMGVRLAPREISLGLSILPGGNKRGDIGYVFYHRVEELAQGERVSAGRILGHAMAHEIGHMLLNSSSHARVGVMQAEWRGPQMKYLREGRLLFTTEQARQLRAEVLRRALGPPPRPAFPGCGSAKRSRQSTGRPAGVHMPGSSTG